MVVGGLGSAKGFVARYDCGMATRTITAYVEHDPATGMYVAVVPGVRGAHTQANSLDELKANLEEVLALCVDEGWLTEDTVPQFSGLQQIEVAV